MDPQQILNRMRDDDDRWDGLEYEAPARVPRPQPAQWRRISIAVVAGLAVGAVVAVSLVGLRGTKEYVPSFSTSSPAADPTEEAIPTPTFIVPSPTRPPESGIETGAELNNEYAWAALHFPRPLPDGVTYPTADLDTSIDSSYEVGLGQGDVAQFWVCSWETEYLQARDAGDESAASEALKQVDAFASFPFTKKLFPDWHVSYDLYMKPAKQGNLEPLRDDLGAGGCA